MVRRPPRSTRTETLFPYTTLFRSTIRMTDSTTHIVFLLFPGITQLDFTAPAQALCRMPGAVLAGAAASLDPIATDRSEEHTSELQSLMRISSAVFCLKKQNARTSQITSPTQTPNKSNSKSKQ